MAQIALQDVSFRYARGAWVLRHLTASFSTSRGSIVAVMGPSGSGKTTLLKLLAGIHVPTSGRITFDPKTAACSYVPQESVLFEHLSRSQNARYFTRVTRLRASFSERAYAEVSGKLKLGEILAAPGSVVELSGGEKQRLALLRALSIKPEFLLLDEPCNGLDNAVKYEFLRTLRGLVDELGLLAVYVTHHPEEIRFIADDVLYLEQGGPTADPAAFYMTLAECLNEPPTLRAARLLYDPFLAVVRGVLHEANLELPDGTRIAIAHRGTAPLRGDCLIAIPAQTVRDDKEGAVELEVVGESSESRLVRFPSFRDAPTALLPKATSQATRVRFDGHAFAFSCDGTHGMRLELNSDSHRVSRGGAS